MVNFEIFLCAGVMLVEIAWLTVGVVWLVVNYKTCPIESAKEVILGKFSESCVHCTSILTELSKALLSFFVSSQIGGYSQGSPRPPYNEFRALGNERFHFQALL